MLSNNAQAEDQSMENATMAGNEIDALGHENDDTSRLSSHTSSFSIVQMSPTNKRSRSNHSEPGTATVSKKVICFRIPLEMQYNVEN